MPGEGPPGAVLPRGGVTAPPPVLLWGGVTLPCLPPPPPLVPPAPVAPVPPAPTGGSDVTRASRHCASSIALHEGHAQREQGSEGRGEGKEGGKEGRGEGMAEGEEGRREGRKGEVEEEWWVTHQERAEWEREEGGDKACL